jgi:uncharacterized protein (DUF433 family)
MKRIAPRIAVDEAVHSGRPVIEGTRVPVQLVVARLAAGTDIRGLCSEFGLSRDDVLAALAYAAEVLADEQGRQEALRHEAGDPHLPAFALSAAPSGQVEVDLPEAACMVAPIATQDYLNLRSRSVALRDVLGLPLAVVLELTSLESGFGLARLYAALKQRFGETEAGYDDYKSSFGYHFLVRVVRRGRTSLYAMRFTDYKCGLCHDFRKVFRDSAEAAQYPDRNRLYEPLEEDFSTDEMRRFVRGFTCRVAAMARSLGDRYGAEFARTVECCATIYGYAGSRFFEREYVSHDGYRAAKGELAAAGIPVNRTKGSL